MKNKKKKKKKNLIRERRRTRRRAGREGGRKRTRIGSDGFVLLYRYLVNDTVFACSRATFVLASKGCARARAHTRIDDGAFTRVRAATLMSL